MVVCDVRARAASADWLSPASWRARWSVSGIFISAIEYIQVDIYTPCSRATDFLSSARDRQKHALARPRLDSVVRLGDVVQGQGIVGRYRQGSLACCGGEIDSGLTFRRTREVVAAEESDRQVGEEHGPEREVGPVAARGVGRDNAVGSRNGRVQVCVFGEGHLDDAVHALGRVRTDRLLWLRLAQRYSVRDGAVDLIEVALAHHRSDDRRAAPARKLRREGADSAEHPLNQDGLARDGAVAEDRSVRGDAGDPEAGTNLAAHLRRELDSLLGRRQSARKG